MKQNNDLIINEIDITPLLSSYKLTYENIEGVNERTTNGTLIAIRKATKRVLDLEFRELTREEMLTLLTFFNATDFVSVTFIDPLNAEETVTSTFYVSSKDMPYWGDGIWSGLSLTLTEQ